MQLNNGKVQGLENLINLKEYKSKIMKSKVMKRIVILQDPAPQPGPATILGGVVKIVKKLISNKNK